MYIYDLPISIYDELCKIIDEDNNKLEELGKCMQFDIKDIRMIKNSDDLLKLWGNQNHDVNELFILLRRIQLPEAMFCIQTLVDKRYLKLLPLIKPKEQKDDNLDCPAPKTLQKKCEKLHETVSDIKSNTINESRIVIEQAAEVENKDCKVGDYLSVKSSTIPRIQFEELLEATNNWDASAELGRGGFGVVYKARWKNTDVAVKKIELQGKSAHQNNKVENIQLEQTLRELHFLHMYRHDNILPLYAYSVDGPQPCLIYQYMVGGSLEQQLHPKFMYEVLDWKLRLNISQGVARGLQFLHTIGEKPLIHGDIKPANILLDLSNVPKIGDFGLARESPVSDQSHFVVSKVHGTLPYLPFETLRSSKMSTKVDTYSFGVVLFEICTALRPYNKKTGLFLKDYVLNHKNVIEIKDRLCPGGDSVFLSMIDVAKICVKDNAAERPEMVDVLMKLENIVF